MVCTQYMVVNKNEKNKEGENNAIIYLDAA